MKNSGWALVAGGALLILINGLVTPFLPRAEGSAMVMASHLFLLRQSASGVAALLLLIGCLSVHLAQRHVSGAFGALAFGVAFVGCVSLVAVEWTNVFVLNAVARTSADTLAAIDKDPLMTAGFISAAGLFALGWLLLAISAARAKVLPRWAALTILAGLVATPMLQAPLGLAGGIAGNFILGAGFIGMGWAIARR